MREMLQPLRGIIPPLLTPLQANGNLDIAALERLLGHVIRGGAHGVFLLGTTGEGPSLSAEQQKQVIEMACKFVDQQIPVLAGISNTVLSESIELARFACDAGCDAVVAAPPYYFPVQQDELWSYFRQLLAELPLPLVLYNIPAVAGNVLGYEIIEQLLDSEKVVGLKDSSGDLDYFARALELRRIRPDFPILVGPEHLLGTTLAMGGSGGVAGGANLAPKLFVELYDAAIAGDEQRVNALETQVNQLGKIYSVGPKSISTVVARTKAAASLLGLCQPYTAPPLVATPDAETASIQVILEELGLLPLKSASESARPIHA